MDPVVPVVSPWFTDMHPWAKSIGHEAAPSEPTCGRAKANDGAEIGDMLIVRPFVFAVGGRRVPCPSSQTTTPTMWASRMFREFHTRGAEALGQPLDPFAHQVEAGLGGARLHR